MAISKQQPMRSAEIDVIDEVNSLSDSVASQSRDISQLQGVAGNLSSSIDSINQEIGSGFDSENTIERAISGIVRDIGDMSYIPSSSSLANEIGKLDDFAWQFRIGETEEIELSNGAPYSATENFSEPFGSDSNCIVLLQVISSESLQLFELTLTDYDDSGFSYSVGATDSDPHNIRVGYVALCTNYQGGN